MYLGVNRLLKWLYIYTYFGLKKKWGDDRFNGAQGVAPGGRNKG
jgi:hypothetical protein